MLPLTTSVASSSRRAADGSSTFLPRTTLAGTTHNDCLPTSRFDKRLVKLSIRPCARISLAGLFPMLSKGRTAMCLSLLERSAPVILSRMEEFKNRLPTRRTKTAPTANRQRLTGFRDASVPQLGVEACLTYFSRSFVRVENVGAAPSTASPAKLGRACKSESNSLHEGYRVSGSLERAR